VPVWGIMLKGALASPLGKSGLWLLDRVGLTTVVAWALKAVENALARIADRQKAIRKARHTIGGSWAPVIVEDRTRWVVYSGSSPIEIFPAISGDLGTAMRTFDVARLRGPDEVRTARSRAWAKTQLARMTRGRGAGREKNAPSAQIEAVSDALAASGDEGGQALFHKMVDELPDLLDRLSSAPAKTVSEHEGEGIPETPGIYLFGEGVTPIYVGETRNLRERLRQQTSPASRENQASLAWRIALAAASDARHPVSGTAKDIGADEQAEMFRSAKRRVAAMSVRFIELADPVTRAVFEVYAAQALGTDEFNPGETH
jgi:hypothetical protein